jgi:Histidine kinase-, DNA gyrase B-, and HSP90-like ATPase
MISLPDLFEQTLANNPALAADVRKSFDTFEPWLEQSGMPFFPGFTDHSPRHINDVLQTAASLISDSSRELLSAEDVAVLCLAILLHDCGMHLTQDGFRVLAEDSSSPIVREIDHASWATLWTNYLGEANRFGQDRLLAIFGDSEPLRLDELAITDLSERDCLLVGEFVRRHHARLAHEIAINGVPKRDGARLALFGLNADLRDISGLVARSHGMPIRAPFSYIEEKYGLLPEFRRIKIPFLMAVLRISDYVQVQSERALQTLLSVRELRSPISRQEWRAHFAVRDISTRHDDPEALYVHAVPPDVKTFLKLDALFKDIQREMDESWAAIGEVYGRRGPLADLGLTVRRIRSNLEIPGKFARTVQYIPIKAGFEASGPDLLKLLVGPLYNYEYSVGIRELLQNAVDACRERIDLSSPSSANAANAANAAGDADIIVEILEAEDGNGWVTVTDNGVGMNLDTVTQYFLVAGASFRNSDVWKQQHTSELGEVRVMRGGRFGVGVLAAFLLGPEIRVTTRHMTHGESEGIEFSARIDDPIVELRRCAAPIGTSIKVWVSDKEIFGRLRPHANTDLTDSDKVISLDSWDPVDWFVQSFPRVSYRWSGYNKEINAEYPAGERKRFKAVLQRQAGELVPPLPEPDNSWRELPNPRPYKAIFWQAQAERPSSDEDANMDISRIGKIVVNGIRVRNLSNTWSVSNSTFGPKQIGLGPRYELVRPSMSILDPAGVCPINLQRSDVSYEHMGIDDRLAEAMLRLYLGRILPPSEPCRTIEELANLCSAIRRQESILFVGGESPICAARDGIFLAAHRFFSDLQIKLLIFADVRNLSGSHITADVLLKGEAIHIRRASSSKSRDVAWFRAIHGPSENPEWYTRQVGIPSLARQGTVSIVSSEHWKDVTQPGKVNRHIIQSLQVEPYGDHHQLLTSGNRKQVGEVISRTKAIHAFLDSAADVSIWILSTASPSADDKSILRDIWFDMFGGALLHN